MDPKVTAQKVSVILLKDEGGHPIGCVIQNGQRVFYKIEVMSDDDISQLFATAKA